MLNELERTWDDMANNWNQWASPLRPSDEDISLMRSVLADWRPGDDGYAWTRVFMLGVTPEIATMNFPFVAKITAMDQSPNMIHKVWPGNTDVRTAVLGNWFDIKDVNTQDVVLADGSFNFSNPSDFEKLTKTVAQMIKPRGIFVARYFTAPAKQESVSDVMTALQAKTIDNFHAFKFRIGMALQKNFASGVRQGDIADVINQNMIVVQAYFPKVDRDTLAVYQGKNARLYFPTVGELQSILSHNFKHIQVKYPSYGFGKSCPTVSAMPKPIR